MTESLKVKIEADISELEKAQLDVKKAISATEKELKDATVVSRGYAKAQDQLAKELKQGKLSQEDYRKSLNRLQRDEKESQIEVQNLRRELSRLKGEHRALGGSTQDLTGNVNQLGTATKSNAVPALTSFSQVVQDAPYGIQGVSNNIQQLTMQMGYLSRSAGGTGAAFKAMASSLAGPAGILLAVSLVTTAFITYGDKIMDAFNATNKLKKATQDYIGEAMAEASELKVLIDIAQNHEASIVARRKAIDTINEKYGDYLGNLDLEKLKTDKVKDSINELTKSLIQQAQVKGLKDVIGEETAKAAEKTTDLQIKQREAWKDIRKELKALDKTGYWGRVIKDSDDVLGSLDRINKTGEQIPTGLKSAVGSYQEITHQIKNVGKETESALKPYQELQQALQEQVFTFTAVPEFDQDAIELTGKKPEPVRIPVKAVLEMDSAGGDAALQSQMQWVEMLKNQITELERAQSLFPVFSKSYKELGEQIDFAKQRLTGFNDELHTSAQEATDALLKRNVDVQKANEELAANTAAMAQIVGGAFSGMMNQMTDALIDGKASVGDFASMFMKTVARIISAAIGQAIATAIAGGSQAALSTGPAAPFTIGGMIATAVGAVTSAQSKIPKFATGGVVGGNSYTGDKILARLNSGELILNKSQQRALLAQMNAPNIAPGLGGEIPVRVIGEIAGDIINLVSDRADRNRGRTT